MRDSLASPGGFPNNRGLFIPQPIFHQGFGAVLAALLVGIAGSISFRIWARKRQERTGERAPALWVALRLIVRLPLLFSVPARWPFYLPFPQKTPSTIHPPTPALP